MPTSAGFRIFLLLHLLCVIGGFGGLAYNGLYLTLARRRTVGAASVVEVNRQVSGLAELLVYGALLFGIAAVGSSKSTYGFGQAWLVAALALYVVDLGVLHGWIRRHQRRYASITGALMVATNTPPSAEPPEIAELVSLDKRIAAGWGVFNIVVLIVLYLMVFTPGR
ncbi:MAG: hypothetical protein M3Y36_04215 [Actinomycetota bacterium]|nr:hypothetical protein [Actinomycetota bacterium]